MSDTYEFKKDEERCDHNWVETGTEEVYVGESSDPIDDGTMVSYGPAYDTYRTFTCSKCGATDSMSPKEYEWKKYGR